MSLACLAALSLACVVHTHGGWKNDVVEGHDDKPRPDKPDSRPPGETLPEMRCEVYCSSDRIGTSGLRLTLPAEAEVAVDPDRARLDWTIYGFEEDAYQSFRPLEPGLRSSAADASAAYRQSKPETLELAAYDSRQDGSLTLAVEGLEPGLLYRWRLRTRDGDGWKTVATASCSAAVCPADWVDENEEIERVPR